MNVKLNDKMYEVQEGISLALFLEMQGLKPEGIAVAINYEVVPRIKWESTILQENQELMLVRAVSGG